MKYYILFFLYIFSVSSIDAIDPDKKHKADEKLNNELNIAFPSLFLRETHLYVPDSIGDLSCESCVHTPGCPFNYHIIKAMYPDVNSEWILTCKSARKNRRLKSHPLYPVSKIYKAFRKGSIRKMIRQYNKDSRSYMKEVFAAEHTKENIREVFGPVDHLTVPIIIEYDSGYFIITANKEYNLIYPFYAKKIKKKRILLSTAIDSTGLFGDMIVLGYNYQIPDLILENDYDNDAILNLNDNCPCQFNTEQKDDDEDHVGNSCDNCKDVANTGQDDYDNDGVGDACDNCPEQKNYDQKDTDGDGIGDKCEESIRN
jgi:hypothetical protein